MEAGLLDQQELVHREVGGEQAVLQLLEPVRGVLGQVAWPALGARSRSGGWSVTIGLRSRCSPARARVCSLCAASDCRVVSRRVSQASMPTCSLRIRMPPEEWPMVQRTEPPSTTASRVSSPSVMRTDLISSDLRKRPARSTDDAVAQRVGELGHQQLEHDAQVGAVRRQLRHGHAQVEGGVLDRLARDRADRRSPAILNRRAGGLHRHWAHRTAPLPTRPGAPCSPRPARAPVRGQPERGSQITTGMSRPAPSGTLS